MYEGTARSRVEIEYGRRRPAPGAGRPVRDRPLRRPDRIAFWAVAMAVIAMVAAATSAHAGSGGTGSSRGGDSSDCPAMRFGSRALDLGDCGADVRTLHWILKAKSYGVPLGKDFESPTARSVRRFQRRHSPRGRATGHPTASLDNRSNPRRRRTPCRRSRPGRWWRPRPWRSPPSQPPRRRSGRGGAAAGLWPAGPLAAPVLACRIRFPPVDGRCLRTSALSVAFGVS